MSAGQPMGDETRKFLERHFSAEYLEKCKAQARAWAGARAGQVDPSGLVIDALLQVARHHRDLRDVANLKAWFRTILVREVMARLKLERHRRTRELGDEHLRRLPDDRGQDDSAERNDERSWAKAYLGKLLARLSEADREVICLSRLQGLPDAEVAALLEISEEALRQRRRRALQRLQALAQESASCRSARDDQKGENE